MELATEEQADTGRMHTMGVPAGGGRGDQGREQAHGLGDEGGKEMWTV
jgi:hypothetical protein